MEINGFKGLIAIILRRFGNLERAPAFSPLTSPRNIEQVALLLITEFQFATVPNRGEQIINAVVIFASGVVPVDPTPERFKGCS